MGAIITTFPISLSLTTNGLEHTMTTSGILFAPRQSSPVRGEAAAPAVSPARQSDGGAEQQIVHPKMLRQPLFLLMFVMMAG